MERAAVGDELAREVEVCRRGAQKQGLLGAEPERSELIEAPAGYTGDRQERNRLNAMRFYEARDVGERRHDVLAG